MSYTPNNIQNPPGGANPANLSATGATQLNQYGPNAAQEASAGQGSTNPMGLGLSSIQSSAPPYTPIIGQTNASTIQSQMYGNATNPKLPSNEQYTYSPIQNQPNDQLNYTGNNFGTPMIGGKYGAVTTANPNINTGNNYTSYNANTANAEVGQVDPNSLVSNQLTNVLQNENGPNGVPIWAQPAVTAANQQMASLGLGSSTMAGNATASAILTAAIPIATANAQVYAGVQAANAQFQQQTLLSNQAAENAAAQFNSQNETQNNQFFNNLKANIAQFNATQANAMTQFNYGQANALAQFNATQQVQTDEFNSQNQLLVDQSNVQWNRAINTANTASYNAAMQANTQNTFNLSQTALNNEWQEMQDQASWSLSAGENSQNRGLTLASSALNQQTALSILNSQEQSQLFSSLGNFAVAALGGASGIGKSLGLTGNSSSYKGNTNTSYASNTSNYKGNTTTSYTS